MCKVWGTALSLMLAAMNMSNDYLSPAAYVDSQYGLCLSSRNVIRMIDNYGEVNILYYHDGSYTSRSNIDFSQHVLTVNPNVPWELALKLCKNKPCVMDITRCSGRATDIIFSPVEINS